MAQHKIGDTVHILTTDSAKFGGTYTVLKVNPSTYVLKGERAANLKAHHGSVHAGPLPTGLPAHIETFALGEFFDTGAVVTLKRVRGVDPATLYVVTGSTPKGYRVFPLGGSTRYYTGLPSDRLERVETIERWSAPK